MIMGTTISWVLGTSTILGGIAALWYFWDKISAWLFGKKDKIQGARIEDAKSHRGGIHAHDNTGSGASISRAEAEYDITASTKADVSPSPKAQPPHPQG
jgi:hypothetical protein